MSRPFGLSIDRFWFRFAFPPICWLNRCYTHPFSPLFCVDPSPNDVGDLKIFTTTILTTPILPTSRMKGFPFSVLYTASFSLVFLQSFTSFSHPSLAVLAVKTTASHSRQPCGRWHYSSLFVESFCFTKNRISIGPSFSSLSFFFFFCFFLPLFHGKGSLSSLIASLPSSFIRFLVAPYGSSLSLFTSPRSCISRKSTVLSAWRFSSAVLFQAATESALFLWSLGFYSFSPLQLVYFLSLSLFLSVFLSISSFLSFSLLHYLFAFLLSQNAYPTFLHLPAISIDWNSLGLRVLHQSFSIPFLSCLNFLISFVALSLCHVVY